MVLLFLAVINLLYFFAYLCQRLALFIGQTQYKIIVAVPFPVFFLFSGTPPIGDVRDCQYYICFGRGQITD
jgi:hypothetical protein